MNREKKANKPQTEGIEKLIFDHRVSKNPLERIIIDILQNGGFLSKELTNYEARLQQIEMSINAGKVLIKEKDNTIIEAPTGSGKSMAYSIPAIIASKLAKTPVIISTSTKNLQAQLTEKDLPLLQKIFEKYLDIPFTFALCKGRSNYMCIRKWHRFIDLQSSSKKRKTKKRKKQNEQIEMFEEEVLSETLQIASKRKLVKKGLKNAEEKKAFDLIMDWYLNDPIIGDTNEMGAETNKGAMAKIWGKIACSSDDCMGWSCPFHKACYFMKAKSQWNKVDLCIVNHALMFAHRSLVSVGSKGILPESKLVIFDEADHVPIVASSFFGSEITSSWAPYMIDRFLPELSEKGCLNILDKSEHLALTQQASELILASQDFFEKVRKILGSQQTKRFKTPLNVNYKNFLKEIKKILPPIKKAYQIHNKNDNKEMKLVCSSYLNYFRDFMEKVETITQNIMPENCYSIQASFKKTRYGRKITITSTPLDTSKMIQKATKGLNVVYTSATLASNNSLEYFSESIGVDLKAPRISNVILDSPFNHHTNSLLYMPDMPLPSSPSFNIHIANQVLFAAKTFKGGIFVLFTSYQSMTAVDEIIRDKLEQKGRPVFVQGIDGPKNVLTSKFRDAGNAILLGVSSFWVGVDIQGDALSCVIIPKMPFGRPNTPFNEATKEYLTSQGKSYFKDYDLPRAVTMIRQGFGRLIRTKRDRGVVMILDPRLNPTHQYKKSYSNNVITSLPNCKIVHDEKSVKDFAKNKNLT